MSLDEHRAGLAAATDQPHLPTPSIWPFVLGGGLTLLGFGLLTSLAFTALGALVTAWAIAGWIGELRRE